MIRSMTAFASGERTTPWGTLSCELRSVNHRFLEIGTRLPDELRALEPALRERIGARISRGKVDLGFRLRSPESSEALQLDTAVDPTPAGDIVRFTLRATSENPDAAAPAAPVAGRGAPPAR